VFGFSAILVFGCRASDLEAARRLNGSSAAGLSSVHNPSQTKEAPVISQAELDKQKRGDTEVISALKRTGSDLSKPHQIEHHFVCPTPDSAKRIREWGISQGLTTSELLDGEHEGQRYFFFDFIIPTVPTIENIFADTGRFCQLAADHGASYDGWGCLVVK
jgi:regulator of RNase E activity RraB